MTERLHRDIFPTEVFAPGHSPNAQLARVFITDRRVVIYASGGAAPQILVDEPITGAVPPRTKESLFGELRLETATGPITVTRTNDCGCKSPLKRVDPPVPW